MTDDMYNVQFVCTGKFEAHNVGRHPTTLQLHRRSNHVTEHRRSKYALSGAPDPGALV